MPRIAVVDDSHLVRLTIGRALKAQDLEVLEIDPISLAQVWEELECSAPDLLVADLHMPGCPGLALIRQIRKSESMKDLKILVSSAHQDVPTLEQLERLGIQGFLAKPCSASDMALQVKTLLGISV